ncbi:sporulation protein YpjB [Paenibacillus sp. LHD-38]|uniref:sporulation protein YpjB n=1 Tax=Paenibacillus sp. LHD-38 TaxID=3072143 RepID=UPI00280E84A4|nr:sporulation protein YpjB [Paenibacillus sp. LHD-38]MDQ8735426.1 sporulation protein YpjB [Paenibacillus sp. LHD-38]
MKIRFIIPFVLCIVMTIGYANSVWGGGISLNAYSDLLSQSRDKQLERLDVIVSSLYEAAYSNNRQVGFQDIQQLKRVLESELRHSVGKMEGWSAIEKDTELIEQKLMKGVSDSSWLMEASRIRLASDALVRPDQALWLQYESVMLEDLSRVEKAWKRQTDDGAIAARASMTSLETHAVRISTAISIQFGSMREAELKERINYTNRLLDASVINKTNEAMIDRSLSAMKESLNRMFAQSRAEEETTAAVSTPISNPLSWTFFLGAFISAILTFTGWRKYKNNPFGVKPLP